MRSTFSCTLIVAATVIGLCSVALTGAAVEMPQMGGGWCPIKDVNDPHIQELGRWAVSEHVKLANDGMSFDSVVSGREQVYYDGMNYELVIVAVNGAAGKLSGDIRGGGVRARVDRDSAAIGVQATNSSRTSAADSASW